MTDNLTYLVGERWIWWVLAAATSAYAETGRNDEPTSKKKHVLGKERGSCTVQYDG
jgi:hypothetical protein